MYLDPVCTVCLSCGLCFCSQNGAVTHLNSGDKTTLTFQWTPPATSQGHIRFRWVQLLQRFYVDVMSAKVLGGCGFCKGFNWV